MVDRVSTNQLFPIFLKLNQLRLLVVGGGCVSLEKVTAIIANSPDTLLTIVAPEIRAEIVDIARKHNNIELKFKPFEEKDLVDRDLLIVATNDRQLNKYIKKEAKAFGLLCNVADTPDECDFYLSSIVQKGNLKIAISTNGKSPTIAKRIKETLNDVFPDQIDDVLIKMTEIRQTLKGSFSNKVKQLDEITSILVDNEQKRLKQQVKNIIIPINFLTILVLILITIICIGFGIFLGNWIK